MTTETAKRSAIDVEHLLDMTVELEPPQVIGTRFGTRMNSIVRTGHFEGDRLRGEVLPGGGDWMLLGDDRVGQMDVRATLRTDDDELIHMAASGVAAIPEEASKRIAAGERVAVDEMYTRSVIRFETGAERYAWLNSLVTVAFNELVGIERMDYFAYRVL